jgi:hypothetical protein
MLGVAAKIGAHIAIVVYTARLENRPELIVRCRIRIDEYRSA